MLKFNSSYGDSDPHFKHQWCVLMSEEKENSSSCAFLCEVVCSSYEIVLQSLVDDLRRGKEPYIG